MEKQADVPPSKVASLFKDDALESLALDENRSSLEDLDCFNSVEPPPLDWRSDSSSEACSFKDIEEAGSFSIDTPLEELSDSGACSTSFTPTEVENQTSQEAEEPTNLDFEDIIIQKDKDRIKSNEPEPLEKLENSRQTPTENPRQHDQDHAHIQDLLSQLQLFHPTPPSKDSSPEPEPSTFKADYATENLSSSSLLPDVNAYQRCSEGSPVSGLLFTVSNQKELLELLEDPETQKHQEIQESQEDLPVYTEQTTENHNEDISQLPDYQTRYITRSSEEDEMVSVSYGSDVWHSPFQDEFMMSGHSEVLEQPNCKYSDELASHGADRVGETLFIVQKLKSIQI